MTVGENVLSKPIVIYHSHCADGFTGAWVFWNKYKDAMEYHPGVYSHTPPDVTGRDVYLVDFSYRRAAVEAMIEVAKSVTLLDHHASALDDLKGLPGLDAGNCTIEQSGAMIAWKYLHEAAPPLMLFHVQDRDLWQFKLQYTRELSEHIFSQEYDFEVWDKLMRISSEAYNRAVEDGAVVLKKHFKDINQLIQQTKREMVIAGSPVLVGCLPPMMASDAGAIMSLTAPYVASYYDTATHRCFSLRSSQQNPEAADVSKIAWQYGGGGHKHAAGFKVARDHELARA